MLPEWTSACGAWSAAPSVTQPWLQGTDFVCDLCVFSAVSLHNDAAASHWASLTLLYGPNGH